MMNATKLTCINCPMGCELSVTIETGGALTVKGNQCPAGLRYAKEEMTNPVRNVTASVRVTGGDMPMLSVKTARPVPKGKVMECAEALREVTMRAPVEIGAVVRENVAGTGVNAIATREISGKP